MKKLTRAALLVGGAILATQSAFGGFVQNDLYMGFQNSSGGGSADYIINLGAASSIVGQSPVVDLSGAFSSSLFNDSTLQGSASDIMTGVVGGENSSLGAGTADIFMTQLRTSNIGNPAVAGSTLTTTLLQSQDNNLESDMAQIVAPATGSGVLDSSKSWENFIEPTSSANTFYGNIGVNPDSLASSSTVLYEDLYETSNDGAVVNRHSVANPFTYVGYFTLDLTGGSPSLTFTQAVPEPTVLGLLGGAGFLLLSSRRRFSGKNW